jgi:hypothetical protein
MSEQHDQARARGVAGPIVRVVVCMLVAAVVAFPVAVERGIEHARIRDSIGLVPAEFTLTGSSDSQLRLGILGTIRVPVSRGPLGLNVTIDGAPATPSGDGQIASYFSPQMLEVYGGLFHDPGRAIDGYVAQLEADLRHRILFTELSYAVLGGLLLALASLVLDPALLRRLATRPVLAGGAGVALALTTTTALALVEFRDWAEGPEPASPESLYSLPSLDHTVAQGAVTDSAVLRLAIEDALPKVRKLVDRQEQRTQDFVRRATGDLFRKQWSMTAPRRGEVAVLMQSDMHCDAAMISLQREVVNLLDARYGDGTVSLLAISGDLTTNGTAAEGSCIKDERAVAGSAPVAAVTGNHESTVSEAQMKAAGMRVLTGSTVDLGGTSVLGAGDPNRTEMFGSTALRGKATEDSVGAELYATALKDRPDLVLVHEGYAAQSFIGSGVRSMTTFLEARGSRTRWWDDGIRDLPTSAVFYGHWHRAIPPRVVWNSDGSWTLVMELNTSGGAIASPTLNHFSTPWSQPQQPASFPVVFKNRDSGLVTGYQLYSFDTDGSVTVGPRVDVGTSDGRPAVPRPDLTESPAR